MNRSRAVLALLVSLSASNLFAAPAAASQSESGLAAIYSTRLNGHRTASGQIYNASAMTAAHKTLPFGTTVRVTNVSNHKSVVLRINDRGPVQSGRILDISPAAAHKLGMHKRDLQNVELEVLETGTGGTVNHS
ncbi:MAG TPA: septal ring lytic transglycosylase RlpA family protein [Edaphobacter sp.]|jgi:rare lipoprotein A